MPLSTPKRWPRNFYKPASGKSGAVQTIFPDVSKGNVLTGVRDEKGGTRFYLGTQPIGHIADTVFTEAFFGICLSPRTSQPQLRRDVLGRYG